LMAELRNPNAGKAMRRRDVITLLGGVAASPMAARAQQRPRRIGVLVGGLPADDPEWQARGTAFVQALQQLNWTDGRNVRIDYRWGVGDPDRQRKYAEELIGLAPDVILAAGTTALPVLQRATRTLPIVFANVSDPVGNGYVASLSRPGGNTTGFMNVEFSMGGKLLELLKQIAPRMTRVLVLRNIDQASGIGQLGAIQAVAPALGVEVTPVAYRRDADDIERGITAFARGLSDGMIVTTAGGTPKAQRETIITLATRYRLPSVYLYRAFVAEGGLVSYGPDQAEPYRLAASYVDRILKGEKPADLPVQAPTKYELVLNMKTAKALGLDVPASVFARADEVIE
jgi:putative ABC transport system substrate-binding protein